MSKRSSNTSADSLFFKSGIRRTKRKNRAPLRAYTLEDSKNSLQNLSGSFRYDSPGAPLKSTQQLNVDFSDFSQHTFFNSAEAKTQKAFSRIINSFPFDGNRSEIASFVDSLTGFEKHIFDMFPSNSGYLKFSGSSSPTEPGTFIEVNDYKGSTQPSLSVDPTGENVLDPVSKPFTFEFHFAPPAITNDNQVILQKKELKNGITLFLSQTSSTSKADLFMMISSGSNSLTASMEVNKGKFQHVGAVLDRTSGPGGQIKLYRDAVLMGTSSYSHIGPIDFVTASLRVGSGSSHFVNGYSMAPVETLSGALDDLRMWHKQKTQKQIREQRFEEIFAQKDLKLLMRFNEPSGSFSAGGSNLVLDFSGNSLHSSIENFSMDLRNTSSFGRSPVTEASKISTISLFPSFVPITSLHSRFMTDASQYDFSNPNIVTRLVPAHYLTDASQFEGFESETGDISNAMSTHVDQPGGANLGQPQIIAGMLYTFAETFDELKMFVDEFKRLLKVDVLSADTVSDQIMPWLARYYGIELPSLFDDASAAQFLDGKNVRLDRRKTLSLQKVQNSIWRRIFSDLPYIFSTRGTHAGIRSVLASMGINPTGPIRVREFGGSPIRNLGDSFIRRHEVAAMLDMSGSLASAGTLNSFGIDSSRPFIQSSFLSGTRVEPGFPEKAGASGDGFFTSGSWAVEARYKFLPTLFHNDKQSLLRMHVTGASAPATKHGAIFNCVAIKPKPSSQLTGSVILYGNPNSSIGFPNLKLILTGVDIFDGNKWQVSFGRNRNDTIGAIHSSSYFLRASSFGPGGLDRYHATSSLYSAGANPVIEQHSSTFNASGSFLAIGSQSLDTTARFLYRNEEATTDFSGKVSSIRFYSKGLTEDETKTHARNFKSLGVEDPEVNFNFVTNATGSFERLRLDVSLDQPITDSSASGGMTGFDFSQNSLAFAGTGFEASKRIIKPERFDFETLSPNFQSGENPNKVRIRSFLSHENASTYGTEIAPLHELPQNEQPQDDKRVAIEISVTQGLNEDIMAIFATLNALDNVIGSPELVFSQDYPSLRNLRRIYFQRLTEKVHFQRFFDFFKFFDDTIGDLLEQMLPSNTKFKGSSYVVEPHALERAKFVYNYYDMYLGESDRGDKSIILMQLLAATLRKM